MLAVALLTLFYGMMLSELVFRSAASDILDRASPAPASDSSPFRKNRVGPLVAPVCVLLLTFMVMLVSMGPAYNVPGDLPNPVTLSITSAETGDRGCYISGTEHNSEQTERSLMAEHGCEDLLEIGKSYVLTWTEGSVLAAVCEGDVDCPHSDTEAIVSDIKPAAAPKPKPSPDPTPSEVPPSASDAPPTTEALPPQDPKPQEGAP